MTTIGQYMSRPRKGGIRLYVCLPEPASCWRVCDWSRWQPSRAATRPSRTQPASQNRRGRMPELIWFELSPPRDMDLAAVTALLRPLASRPQRGLVAVPPLVAFELWSRGGAISWRMGVDKTQAGILPPQLAAHLPGLGISPISEA